MVVNGEAENGDHVKVRIPTGMAAGFVATLVISLGSVMLTAAVLVRDMQELRADIAPLSSLIADCDNRSRANKIRIHMHHRTKDGG